ncbi:MAG: ATP-binding cassette domain-containing protein [Anaerolineae bacterium]|nr:ATP-binding cassette domain-containing protein [Anaerolineae bacterium]
MNNREIVADNLAKKYGDFYAVNGVSFKVNSGEIYGFLGPNGAGKSTCVSMMTTLILPTSGKATVGSYDVVSQANEVRRIAGVALQDIGLDPLMKSMELLTIQAQTFGYNRKQAQERAHYLLDLVKLSSFTDRRVGKYSGGMRRRLDLALALVHEPDILFLDEPTTGLDPASRRDIWTEVRRLNKETGMTIFLTTQYLEEADELADRIAIITAGKIAVEGTPSELKSKLGTESINITFREADQTQKAAEVIKSMGERVQIDRKVLRIYMAQAAAAIPAVVTKLQQAGLEPTSLTLTQPTLDDVFLQVTGESFTADEAEEAVTA